MTNRGTYVVVFVYKSATHVFVYFFFFCSSSDPPRLSPFDFHVSDIMRCCKFGIFAFISLISTITSARSIQVLARDFASLIEYL
jgi:hypothetical protein